MSDLRKYAAQLDPILKNVNHVSGEGGEELIALLKDVRDTNKSVQQRLASVEAELSKTLAAAGKGFAEAEGAVKGARTILAESEDDVASLLMNLKETSRNLKELSEDIRSHPWKVVWKADGPSEVVPPGSEKWREKGRMGPYGKQ